MDLLLNAITHLGRNGDIRMQCAGFLGAHDQLLQVGDLFGRQPMRVRIRIWCAQDGFE